MDTTPATPTPPPPPEDHKPRRLLRSRDDKILGGAAAGLGRYFDVDPIIFRIGFVVATFFGGAGLFAYIALLLFVPRDDGSANPKPIVRASRRTLLIAMAVVIAAVAGVVLAVGAAWASAEGSGELVAGGVILLGLGMVAAAFRGGKAWRWLAVPAVLLAVPAGAVAASGFELEGGYGDRTYRPSSVDAIHADGYKLAMGQLRIDLTRIDFRPGQTVDVEAKLGFGELDVLVPKGVCVEPDAHVGAGDLDVRGTHSDGTDLDVTDRPAPSPAPRVRLKADVDLGELRVQDAPVDDDASDRRARATEACAA
jgi:phage shock protein PspC (stress-responsive transcriptional regulator)